MFCEHGNESYRLHENWGIFCEEICERIFQNDLLYDDKMLFYLNEIFTNVTACPDRQPPG